MILNFKLIFLISFFLFLGIFLYLLQSRNEVEEEVDDEYTILVKLPSRGRPQKLVDVLKKYIAYAEKPDRIIFLITLDSDDETADYNLKHRLEKLHKNVKVMIGKSGSKIKACNRDVDKFKKYDIIVLASDDMTPVEQGYDDIIRKNMREYFPDTDGVLFFNDGFRGRDLNTMCILGKKYYDRFGYIYHPSYRSFFCDNEFMIVADKLNRQIYFEQVIFKHEHYDNVEGVEEDELYKHNSKYFKDDEMIFHQRMSTGFVDE
jgi:hypothetical protein